MVPVFHKTNRERACVESSTGVQQVVSQEGHVVDRDKFFSSSVLGRAGVIFSLVANTVCLVALFSLVPN